MKLYSTYVEYTKLIKYHFSKNHAIFFFVYRKEHVGVHFNLILSIEELAKNIKYEKYLIEEGTNIFIMKKIDLIETIPFDHEVIKQHIDNFKWNNALSNELVFELTRDFADPI